jgi:hypothetical protein
MHPLPTASERAEHYKCKDRLPPGFDAWFARCVSRPMEPRFADAAEAFAALEPLLLAVCEPVSSTARRSSAVFASQDLGNAPKAAAAARASSADDAGPRPQEPEASVSTGPGGAASTASGRDGVPVAPPTGPGRATWEGAPELAEDAVRSATISGPVPPPPPSTPTPPTPHESAHTVDEAELVEARPHDPPGKRTRTVIVVASLTGMFIGAAIFGFSRGGGSGRRATGAATSAAITASAATIPLPVELTPDPPAPAVSAPESSAAGDVADAGAAGAHRGPKLCKPAGAKCFGNDDCCDRTCRLWTCRANPALEHPYETDEK